MAEKEERKNYYGKTVTETLEDFDSSKSGLSDEKVEENREKYGENKLYEKKKESIIKIFFDVFFGNLERSETLFLGSVYNLVIDVRKVLDIFDVVSAILHILSERIKYDYRTCISDVKEIIYGRTADIYRHLLGIERREFFFCARKRIVNLHKITLP